MSWQTDTTTTATASLLLFGYSYVRLNPHFHPTTYVSLFIASLSECTDIIICL